jgi:hypothetical protein
VAKGASEGASLVFYLMVGYKFRPHPENPYLRVDEEEEGHALSEWPSHDYNDDGPQHA